MKTEITWSDCVCINNHLCESYQTPEKIYKVKTEVIIEDSYTHTTQSFFGDDGIEYLFFSVDFMSIDEWREFQLNRLGI